jgi:hypothetical protein
MSSSITAMGRTTSHIDADNAKDRIEPGQAVTFDAATHLNEVDTDPTELTFKVISPTGITTTYVYGDDPEITRLQTGHYRIEFPVPAGQNSVGTWKWSWDATGVVAAHLSGELVVSDSADQVTLTVLDPEAVPVVDALISVFRGSTLITQRRTNASGVGVVHLEDGIYQVEVAKDGYRTPTTSLIVSGTTGATITSTDLKTQGLAPTLRLCRVFGHVLDVSGQPMMDVNILAEPVGVSVRAFVSRYGGVGINPVNQGVARDRRMVRARSSDGYWEIDLLCGSIVKLSIPAMGVIRIFRVPNSNSINLADVRTDVGQPSLGSMRGERYQLI